MPRYAIAFITKDRSVIHKVVELESRESALQFFFQNFINGEYSKDDEGYTYFREDFDDPEVPAGSVLEV